MQLPQCARKKIQPAAKIIGASKPMGNLRHLPEGVKPGAARQARMGHHRLTFYFPLAMVPVAVLEEIKN